MYFFPAAILGHGAADHVQPDVGGGPLARGYGAPLPARGRQPHPQVAVPHGDQQQQYLSGA